ncbi:MAG: hypothetical protein LUC83_09185, partial [Clostridiales bacterium]|nr:hypothetical protein [Clostridiales bacterium]
MTKNDWYEAGDQIKRLVQDAVDTGDFSQLGNTIADVVNDTMDGLQDAIRGNLGGNRRGGWTYDRQEQDGNSSYGGYGTGEGAYDSYNQSDSTGADEQKDGYSQGQTAGDDAYDQTYRGSADRVRRAYEQTAGRGRQAYEQAANRSRQAYERTRGRTYEQTNGQSRQGTQRHQPVQVKRRVPGELGSKLMKYIGYGMGVVFGASLALEAAAAAAIGDFFLFAAGGVTTGLCFGGSVLLGVNGQRRLGATRRFKRYQEVIGTRTYCMIEELAAGIGESSSYVKKDLKKMIRRGYFPVGYLDRKETLLITDQSTYQQYLQAEAEYEKRQSEQRMDDDENRSSTSAQDSADAGMEDSGKTERTPEHQALIEEGQKYIRHIHECNEKIPDAQITAKLDRLELVVTRIFRE